MKEEDFQKELSFEILKNYFLKVVPKNPDVKEHRAPYLFNRFKDFGLNVFFRTMRRSHRAQAAMLYLAMVYGFFPEKQLKKKGGKGKAKDPGLN